MRTVSPEASFRATNGGGDALAPPAAVPVPLDAGAPASDAALPAPLEAPEPLADAVPPPAGPLDPPPGAAVAAIAAASGRMIVETGSNPSSSTSPLALAGLVAAGFAAAGLAAGAEPACAEIGRASCRERV